MTSEQILEQMEAHVAEVNALRERIAKMTPKERLEDALRSVMANFGIAQLTQEEFESLFKPAWKIYNGRL